MSLADQVVPGKTTSKQIEEWFGKPSAIANGADGTKTYQYYYSPYNWANSGTHSTTAKRLEIQIDNNGLVNGVTKVAMPVTVSE